MPFSVILTMPLSILAIARPILLWWAAHQRRKGAWRVRPPSREAVETRPEPAIRSLQASIDAVRAMRVELPSGKHLVRVGLPGLGHWQAAEVEVKDGVEHRLEANVAE